MNKLLLGSLVLLFAHTAKAEGLGDQIQTALLGRVSLVEQFGNHGSKRTAAVDNIISVGKFQGRTIIQGQGGLGKENSEGGPVDWIYGAQVRLDPFITPRLNISDAYTFLKALEYGPAIHHHSINHEWIGYFQVGYGFGPNPQP
jgi:hypothetical protein